MRNNNNIRNSCEKHGILEIDELYIRNGEPKCNICHKALNFSEQNIKLNGGEDVAKLSVRGVRDELAEKLLTFAKRLDSGVKDNEVEHLKLLRKSVSRVHFLLSREINETAKK